MNGFVTKRKSAKKTESVIQDGAKEPRFAVRFKNESQFFELADIIDNHGGPQHVLERLIPWWAALDDITRAMLIGAVKPRDDLLRLILDRESRRFLQAGGLDHPDLPGGRGPRDGGPAGDKPRGDAKK
jgi:hypothetical protein